MSTKSILERADDYSNDSLYMSQLVAKDLIRDMRDYIAGMGEQITDILSPAQDYSWVGKWRVLRVLEMMKENNDGR